MSRRNLKYIVGNWKMNQKLSDIKDFFVSFNQVKAELHCHSWIAPQYIHIPILKELSFTLGNIEVGAQNCSHKTSGALTGEVSPESLFDIGVTFVILGHSERRQFFAENNQGLSQKIKMALDQNLKVIYCVGETAQENEERKTFTVLKEQLSVALQSITSAQNLLIAYEPVWAIGTGKTATPEIAEKVHTYIRQELCQRFSEGEEIPLLYGGSANPQNISGLFSMPNIDGALIGGASLKAKDFIQMCHASRPFARI